MSPCQIVNITASRNRFQGIFRLLRLCDEAMEIWRIWGSERPKVHFGDVSLRILAVIVF
jgi:hypothetical protein